MLSNLLFDPREKLVPSHSFLVAIGPALFSFSRVSNLVSQIEYDAVTEGGNNDYPHLFKKPKSQPDTLILERACAPGLPIWYSICCWRECRWRWSRSC